MTDLPPVPPGALPGGAPPARYPLGPPLAAPHPPVPPGAGRPGSPWPLGSTPPPEPPRRPKPWVVIAAVLAVLALVAATFAAFAGGGDDERGAAAVDRRPRDRDPGTGPAPSDPPAPTEGTTPAPGDLQSVVDEIQAFVSAERGLPFLRDVTVELADDEAFEERLLEDFEEEADELAVDGRVLTAVGLVEPGTDLVEAMRTLLGAGVVGFYDPETDELVVRGTSTTPYVRTVIAHELVHALDDQHFELHRPELDDAVDESGFGFTTLLEGNASRIEEAYRATLTPEEEERALSEELSVGLDVDLFSLPPILLDLLVAPYVLGPELVAAILDDGGQERLDTAFAEPPTTSEQVLDPSTFLGDEGAAGVTAPATDDGAPAIDEGVLGALGLAEILGLSPLTLPGAGPLDASVEGWGGDRYVAWDEGDRTCLRASIVGDSPEDTEEIAAALVEWAGSAPFDVAASVERPAGDDGPLTLTSCSG